MTSSPVRQLRRSAADTGDRHRWLQAFHTVRSETERRAAPLLAFLPQFAEQRAAA